MFEHAVPNRLRSQNVRFCFSPGAEPSLGPKQTKKGAEQNSASHNQDSLSGLYALRGIPLKNPTQIVLPAHSSVIAACSTKCVQIHCTGPANMQSDRASAFVRKHGPEGLTLLIILPLLRYNASTRHLTTFKRLHAHYERNGRPSSKKITNKIS